MGNSLHSKGIKVGSLEVVEVKEPRPWIIIKGDVTNREIIENIFKEHKTHQIGFRIV